MRMSPETAAWVSDWANLLLLGSLIVGVVSTYAIFVAGNVKETALKREVASANAEAAKANEATAKTQERAAALEKEAAELRQKMAWRRISQAQHKAIVDALKGHKFKVWTSFVGHDPEASILRDDIDKTLRDAGLETQYFSGWEKAVGLQITEDPAGPERDALIAAFAAAGIKLWLAKPLMMKGELQIIVGTKPPPF